MLFDLDRFADIFEAGVTDIAPAHDQAGFTGWLAPRYRQTAQGERGYFYEEDFRGRNVPRHEGEGEPFDYYCLANDDQAFELEVEVWPDGATDVMLTRYRPLSDIKELWPGGGVASR